MQLQINGRTAFAYTAAHDVDPAKRSVVFVHGAGLDHSWWGLQSRYFGYHGFNVLAVDLPAHGRSAGPALAAIGEMADWIAAILNSLKIEQASLVGHSMGALIALEFAARYSRRAEKLALIGVAYPMKVSEAFLHGYDLGARSAGAARGQPEPGHVDVRRHAGAPRAPCTRRTARRSCRLQYLCRWHGRRGKGDLPCAFHPRRARRDDTAERGGSVNQQDWKFAKRTDSFVRPLADGRGARRHAKRANRVPLNALIGFLA
jgi:pimeloyl-ACP methyl ester carboxylesterase